MIGEDGRMNERGGGALRRADRRRGPGAVVAALREEGALSRRGALHPLGPVLAPLRASGSSR